MKLRKEQIEVVDDVMAEVLRRKTPAERIAIGFSLWTSARQMLTVYLEKTYPDWDEGRIRREIAKRFLAEQYERPKGV
jgi:hypothetical protein